MIKYITVITALIISSSMVHAQENVVVDSQSMVIMSEADIISLAKTLRQYKKVRAVDVTTNSKSTSNNSVYGVPLESQNNNTFEVDYLRSQIEQLENKLNNGQKNNVARIESSTSNLNDRKLKNMEFELTQLKYAMQQMSSKPNDNVVFVTPPQNQASNVYQPKEIIIREQVPVNNSNDIVVRQKLDSLNALFKNLKHADNTNYTGDFDALQKRMDALKNEMLAKNTAPSNYDVLVLKYKNYNRDIYFADNSKVLNAEASQAIEEFFTIIDSNSNLDVVVKGFASNKGNAIYNENLSMQRTEAVKKALMIRGVHPTRVLTQYHGIDYNAQTATKARRVEVSILVRK